MSDVARAERDALWLSLHAKLPLHSETGVIWRHDAKCSMGLHAGWPATVPRGFPLHRDLEPPCGSGLRRAAGQRMLGERFLRGSDGHQDVAGLLAGPDVAVGLYDPCEWVAAVNDRPEGAGAEQLRDVLDRR